MLHDFLLWLPFTWDDKVGLSWPYTLHVPCRCSQQSQSQSVTFRTWNPLSRNLEITWTPVRALVPQFLPVLSTLTEHPALWTSHQSWLLSYFWIIKFLFLCALLCCLLWATIEPHSSNQIMALLVRNWLWYRAIRVSAHINKLPVKGTSGYFQLLWP